MVCATQRLRLVLLCAACGCRLAQEHAVQLEKIPHLAIARQQKISSNTISSNDRRPTAPRLTQSLRPRADSNGVRKPTGHVRRYHGTVTPAYREAMRQSAPTEGDIAGLSKPLRWLHIPKCGQSFMFTLIAWGCPNVALKKVKRRALARARPNRIMTLPSRPAPFF